MKTSFYFLLWIIIYPILDLVNSPVIEENSFLIALAVVWGLSWFINRSMPHILARERALEIVPILEDIYSGNIAAFRKRLSGELRVGLVTSFYFLISTVVILFAVIAYGASDWIALLIFAFFTIGQISRTSTIYKSLIEINHDPSREQCSEAARRVYNIDYSGYEGMRASTTSSSEMLPPPAPRFKTFLIVSLIIAALCAISGVIFLGRGIILAFFADNKMIISSIAVMNFLYGSLAAYFGVKDFISSLRALRHK